MTKLCNSKAYHLIAQWCKKPNGGKNGRFRYDVIGETQPEIELLEVVVFIYQFSLNQAVQYNLQSESDS